MHTFNKVLSEDEIKRRVVETAKEISSDYKDKDLVLIGILKGSSSSEIPDSGFGFLIFPSLISFSSGVNDITFL